MAKAPAAAIADRFATVIVWATALAVTAGFAWLLGDLLAHGLGRISWGFLTETPRNAGRAGGIGPILVSTLLIVGTCLTVSLPIGVAAAVWLSEFASGERLFGRLPRGSRSSLAACGSVGRLVRRSLDVLAGVPSIVFGLFGNALFCRTLGMGFSILSGGLTLACMVLPLLIRATEEGLRAVPADYRLNAAALGFSKTTTLFRLLLPAAVPGLVVGLVLGIGRAVAETAALIFTSGYVDRMPTSLLDSGRSLSIHIFDLSMNVPGGDANAYASSLVLVALLIVINWTAASLAESWRLRRIITA